MFATNKVLPFLRAVLFSFVAKNAMEIVVITVEKMFFAALFLRDGFNDVFV
jgi:hypothetical protein